MFTQLDIASSRHAFALLLVLLTRPTDTKERTYNARRSTVGVHDTLLFGERKSRGKRQTYYTHSAAAHSVCFCCFFLRASSRASRAATIRFWWSSVAHGPNAAHACLHSKGVSSFSWQRPTASNASRQCVGYLARLSGARGASGGAYVHVHGCMCVCACAHGGNGIVRCACVSVPWTTSCEGSVRDNHHTRANTAART